MIAERAALAGSSSRVLLEVRGASVALGGVPVLRDVSLSVTPGAVVGLVGPNGAGKTSLLRLASGVVPADSGEVLLDGRPVRRIDRRERARRMAVVQQLPEAPAHMLVGELVLLGRHPHLGLLARESSRDRARAGEAMRRAGCVELARRPLGTLSGGQRRRAFIARALAQDPELLLLDEPTANLDPGAQVELFEIVRDLAREGVAVLAVVHELSLAAAYCDRVALLAGGRLIADGDPSSVLSEERVRIAYGPGVEVIAHPRTGAPLVVPARRLEE